MGESVDLEQLALTRFGSLSGAEVKLLRAAFTGETAYCGPSEQNEDSENDPSGSENWDASREVRSDLVRWLCIDRGAKDYVDRRGLRVHGAKIRGPLDLSFAAVEFPLSLSRCRLTDALNLTSTELPSIDLAGTWLSSLSADGVAVKGSILLKDGFCSTGKVQLRAAQIGGNLECDGGQFRNPVKADVSGSGTALNAQAAKVAGAVLFRNSVAEGEVRLFHAQIGGNLECNGAQFRNPGGPGNIGSGVALNAESAKIAGAVFLRGNFNAEGSVRLFNAQIGANLVCDDGQFHNPAGVGSENGMALNAEAAKIGGSVFMRNNFKAEGRVRLFRAEIGGSLACDGGTFQNPAVELGTSGIALDAEAIRVTGAVLLRGGFLAEGQVKLFAALIQGDLDCQRATIKNPWRVNIPNSGVALAAEFARIDGSALLRREFSAEGEVRLSGAAIGRSLDCAGGTFVNPPNASNNDNAFALVAFAITVGGAVLLREGFSAAGQVNLTSSSIEGNLDCKQALFTNPAQANISGSGLTLNAAAARVGGRVILSNGFSAEGEVRLSGAEIGRGLDCSSGRFLNRVAAGVRQTGVALNASAIKVAGDVLLRDHFLAQGSVRVSHAQIGGNFDCEGGEFQNPGVADGSLTLPALSAEAVRVAGSVLLRYKFSAQGRVRLFGAEIGGFLDCDGGTFSNPAVQKVDGSGLALDFGAVKVTGAVFLRNKFAADGEVRLSGVSVGKDLECTFANLSNAPQKNIPNSGTALSAIGAKVDGSLIIGPSVKALGAVKLVDAQIARSFRCTKSSLESLDLTDAFAGLIADDQESWPKEGRLRLDGFVYGRISKGPLAASERLEWLSRQPLFRRQPYHQLAKVLGEAGDELGGRRVLSEMQRRVWSERPRIVRGLGPLLQLTIGYGYFPLRAIWLLLVLVIVGTVMYSTGYTAGSITPTLPDAYSVFATTCSPPNYYEHFHPFAYSLENSFPLVKLGVQDKWAPAADGPVPLCLPADAHPLRLAVIAPAVLRWFKWIQICFGWILTTLFVGGVTGVLRKN